MTVATMCCVLLGFVMALQCLGDDPLFRAIIPTKIVEVLFYVFFILLLISNTISSIGNTYASPRMDLFLYTPVSNIRLYLAKLIETYIETGLFFFVFAAPAYLAYVYVYDLTWKFLVVALLLGIPFLLIPAGISMLLSTIYVRAITLFWGRGLLLVVCGVVAVGWLLTKMFALVSVVRREGSGAEALLKVASLLDNPSPFWLPSRWISDVLSSFLGTPLPSFGIYALLTVSSALGSVALGYLVFDLFMFRVRSLANTNRARGNGTTIAVRDLPRRLLERLYRAVPVDHQFRAVIIKDLTSLIRDRAQSFQLLLFLGITMLYVMIFNFMTVALQLDIIATQLWWAVLATINVIFVGIILTAVMTRLVYPSMSLEGVAFWILAVAPIRKEQLVRAKFWCWFPITLLLVSTLLLSGTTAIGLDPALLLITFIIGLGISIGYTGLAIGLGAVFVRFDWESPNQASAGLGALVLLLASLGLTAIICVPSGAAITLSIVPVLRERVGHVLSYFIMSGSLFFVLLINISAAYFACKRGGKALAELDE